MFKSARWRSDKNKIKTAFKLQFLATQVPRLGWETMMVTLVPMDVGRPTARSEKAKVVDGSCRWPNPIYETVKFTQDPRTGKINDKVYQFLTSAAGSTKSGLLGEITINFADYADAFNPLSLSLPLRASNSGAILHVTLQRMHGDVESSDADVNGDVPVKKQRKTLQNQLSIGEIEEGSRVSNGTDESTEDYASLMNSKAQVKFPSSRNIPLRADPNDNLRKSSSFDAISASGSDSSSGQFTPKENRLKNNSTYQDSASLLSNVCNSDNPQNPMNTSIDSVANTNWSISSAPNGSVRGSTNSSGEHGSSSQESDDSPGKLRNDVIALKRQLQVSELELLTLRKQVVKENRRGQDLSRELASLKEERDVLRRECDELKASRKRIEDNGCVLNKLSFDGEDWPLIVEEIKQELSHEKNTNANLRLQLKKTQEANSELILAVRDLEEILEQKNGELSNTNIKAMAIKLDVNRDIKEGEQRNGFAHLSNSESKTEHHKTSENEEQCALDILVKEQDDVKAACAPEQKIIDLNNMVDLYKKDREEIEMQMEQLALDYEILKQENHDLSSKLEQTQLREQLRMQYECSAHFSIINDLESHVESLEKELHRQADAFEADLASIANAKVEQEKRAIQAEEALRKIQFNNAHSAEQLQEELKRLSSQMSSTFSVNEKLVIEAVVESNELRMQNRHMEQLLEKTNKELASIKRQCHVKFQQLLSLINFKTKEADRLFQELKDKQRELEDQKKLDEEMKKASLDETRLLKAEMEKLSREKQLLSENKEKLVTEMENLMAIVKSNEVSLQKINLERNTLQIELISMTEKANKSFRELKELNDIMHEKETLIRNLKSELATLRLQYTDLTYTLFKDESDNENLNQQVFQSGRDLEKKEYTSANLERKLKDSNADPQDGDRAIETAMRNKDSKANTEPHYSTMEVSASDEKNSMHQGERKSEGTKMEDMRNLCLQKKIVHTYTNEETERSTKKISRNNSGPSTNPDCKGNIFNRHSDNKYGVEKDLDPNCEQSSSDILQEECNLDKTTPRVNANDVRNDGFYLLQIRPSEKTCTPGINNVDEEVCTRSLKAVEEKGEESSISCTCDQPTIGEALIDMRFLKERNQQMEAELKEMQERYSEISLKFAEVEGERQQLVMNVRTLKNALKK